MSDVDYSVLQLAREIETANKLKAIELNYLATNKITDKDLIFINKVRMCNSDR